MPLPWLRLFLLPVLCDKDAKARDYAVCECVSAFPLIADQRMYREGRWKYVFNAGGSDELYDLEADPYEMNDLIDDPKHESDLKKLREGLAKAMYSHGDGAAPWFCKMNHLLDWEL